MCHPSLLVWVGVSGESVSHRGASALRGGRAAAARERPASLRAPRAPRGEGEGSSGRAPPPPARPHRAGSLLSARAAREVRGRGGARARYTALLLSHLVRRDDVQVVAELLALEELLRQVLEVALREGELGGDHHLRLVARAAHGVAEVARLAADLDRVGEELLEQRRLEQRVLDRLRAVDRELDDLLLAALLRRRHLARATCVQRRSERARMATKGQAGPCAGPVRAVELMLECLAERGCG